MRKLCVLLSFVAVVSAAPQRLILEESVTENGYRLVESIDGKHFEIVNGERDRTKDKLRTEAQALELPFVVTDKVYRSPTDIAGVNEDIPFNYHATLDQSAEYIFSLLNDGFKVSRYEATPKVISMELVSDRKHCRILVYENYMKAYMPGREEP